MESSLKNSKIEIGQETLNKLNATRKWTMFLAILGFIFLGLLIVIGIITGTFLSAFSTGGKTLGIPESLLFVPILLMAIIFFFPVLFLFRFSKHTAMAIQFLDKQELHKAIRNLKSYFVYLGALIIVVLSVYIVVLIVAGTSMSLLKGLS